MHCGLFKNVFMEADVSPCGMPLQTDYYFVWQLVYSEMTSDVGVGVIDDVVQFLPP